MPPTITTRAIERTLTELDFARLHRLAGVHPPQWLADLLDGADVIDGHEVPPDTVTMYSRVRCEDLHTGRQQTLTVCYPAHAQPQAGFVSVLSPVGCSLLGLRTGDIARWRTPQGEDGAAKVLDVLFQPEAEGDYTL
ncbi:MAG: GreA/GreB family elongation factor [Burkholderiaceae bacterium]|nr:GreA/GreB family elongation factor [Rhodoferax sp.]MCB2005163.1 GreA/GreB family elongation factor [Rhodoferax sp.]MCB2030796.1 GreA/GreB family elongation factor [Rhodoferax sp.]MCB2043663.1 GreA/GreB family elongation factor [Rhodoferax sp.]MCP5260390.1 GreA/GreB family elongation factor [Rhodoferax sp.]